MSDLLCHKILAGPSRESLVRLMIRDEIGLDNLGIFATTYGRRIGFVEQLDNEKVTILGYYSHTISLKDILAVKTCAPGECADFDVESD